MLVLLSFSPYPTALVELLGQSRLAIITTSSLPLLGAFPRFICLGLLLPLAVLSRLNSVRLLVWLFHV